MIGERIARAARYLRVTGDGGVMSLTNIVLLVVIVRFMVARDVGLADFGALVLAVLNTNARKILKYVEASRDDVDESRLQKLEAEVKQLAAIENVRQLGRR